MNNTRICNKCGRGLPATNEYFRNCKKDKQYGLGRTCKSCLSAIDKEYRKTTTVASYQKDYHDKYNKQYYKDNQKELQKKSLQYYEKNKDTVIERVKEYNIEYQQTDKYKALHRIYTSKRRNKEKQGKGLQSYEIAQEILNEWFDNSCAYSGKKLTNDTINWDHIIPLKKNGVNEIWNLIPSYCTYNNRKSAKEPYKWYKEQEYYDEDRLNYIIYYQKVMYWNFANKDSEALVLITGEIITYEEIEEEYGILKGAE